MFEFKYLPDLMQKKANEKPKEHSRKCFIPHEERNWHCKGKFAKDGSLYAKCCECVWCDVQTATRPENIQKGIYYH